MTRPWLIPGVCLVLVACEASAPPPKPSPPTPDVVRECDPMGDGEKAVGQRASNIVAGPLTFVSARSLERQPPNLFSPISPETAEVTGGSSLRRIAETGNLFPQIKQLILSDAHEAVIVAVADQQRSVVGLDMAPPEQRTPLPGNGGLADLSAVPRVVKFEGCESLADFPGALVVNGARCVELAVWSEGAAPITARIPAGRPCD